jgi:hypothetical protein
MFRNHLAFSLPVPHSASHLAFAMDWIDLFCADFIIILEDMLFGMAAIFAAWSTYSFPSMFLCPGTHPIWMLQVGIRSWILSTISRVFSVRRDNRQRLSMAVLSYI